MQFKIQQQHITCLGSLLVLLLLPAWTHADNGKPDQVPLYLSITPSKPNIMLLIDSSGSMEPMDGKNCVTPPFSNACVVTGALRIDAMPADTTYTCNIANAIPNVNPATGAYVTIKLKISDSSPPPVGTVLVCRNSSCSSYTQFSSDYCFATDKSYKVAYFDGTAFGTYLGLNLDWYFTNGTFKHATNLVAQGVNQGTRMEVAKKAAKNFVYSLTPDVGSPPTVRLGLAKYDGDDGDDGAKLLKAMTPVDHATVDTINTQIDGINASGYTPLAEALADIGSYFTTGNSLHLILHPGTASSDTCSISTVFKRDIASNDGVAPIESYCQKNFAIVISDGLPNKDRNISTKLTDYSGDCGGKSLCDPAINDVDYDGSFTMVNGSSNCNTSHHHKACKNGSKVGSKYERFGTDFLDDVAQALYEIDLRPDFTKPASYKSNITTYTVGLADPDLYPPNVFSEAARLGGGKFFFAEDAEKLATSLEEIIKEISGQSGTSAAMSASTSTTTTATTIFQAKFDSSNWTGDLLAYPVIDDTTGEVADNPIWNAAQSIPPWGAERTILTYVPSGSTSGAGKLFQCDQLNSEQKDLLDIRNCADANDEGVWRLNYLRGDWHHEVLNDKRVPKNADDIDIRSATTLAERKFRNRNNLYKEYDEEVTRTVNPILVNTTRLPDPWLLGDIVNSNPVFVGNEEDYGYEVLSPEGSSYTAFRTSTSYTQRRPMVYVGANDGMLHGFDATNATATPTSVAPGREMVAYIPNAVYSKLKNLISTSYKNSHLYFVDGSPHASDAYFSGEWHTVLVGTTGAGAKDLERTTTGTGARGIFALDITNPGVVTDATSTFTPSNVLWEVSDRSAATTATTDLDSDTTTLRGFANNLGYTMSQPSIVRMNNGSWAAIVANGYDSTGNRAVLYILDIKDGHIIRTIEAINSDEGSFTSENGLSTPFVADLNSDTIADYIYAGDLRGNLWKFDVNSTTISDWKVANDGKPLYVACDDINKKRSDCPPEKRQPITATPVIGAGKTDTSYMVYFGTGKYFEFSDNNLASAHTQTFYGIIDKHDGTVVPNASDANVRSTLVSQTIDQVVTQNGKQWRITSSNPCGSDGWYMNLPETGERVVSFPQLHGSRVIFVTLIPSPPDDADIDPCGTSSGGTGWLMELSAMCGTRLPSSPWDVNNDGKIDGSDLVNGYPPSGVKSEDGIPLPPPIVKISKKVECKYVLVNKKPVCMPETRDSTGEGRQSWRQIR